MAGGPGHEAGEAIAVLARSPSAIKKRRWRQRQRNGGRDLPADDQVRVEHAIAAGSESESAT